MQTRITKKDFILIGLILLIAVSFYIYHNFLAENQASTVTVKIDGKESGTYSLDKDQTIELNNGTNILQIKDGKADMIEADCPDKLCVNQKAISKENESIICLPNKIVVEIENGEQEFDVISN